jgi:hypothetical protein
MIGVPSTACRLVLDGRGGWLCRRHDRGAVAGGLQLLLAAGGFSHRRLAKPSMAHNPGKLTLNLPLGFALDCENSSSILLSSEKIRPQLSRKRSPPAST